MRKSLLVLFLFFLPIYGYAQTGFICGTVMEEEQQGLMKITAVSDTGGKYITSEGTITAMIIFARFSDDNETTSLWPNASVLPTWASNLLNPNFSAAGNYTSNSFSDYIYKNSYGKLHIIGDVFYVTLPQTESYYYNYSSSAFTIRAK
jgi:hypothetical protein